MSPKLIHAAAVLAVTAAALAPLSARAQAIFSPIAVPVNTAGDFDASADIGQTIDQSGLFTGFASGVTNFDSYIASNPLHDQGFSGREWFSAGGVTTGTIVYDLGAGAGFDRLALWNEDSIGIATMTVDASNDLSFSVGVTSFGVFAPTNNPEGANYPAQVFALAPTSARYVRLQVQAPVGAAFVSMGEIAFRSAAVVAVPEAGTLALALPALAMVGTIVIRRRKGAK